MSEEKKNKKQRAKEFKEYLKTAPRKLVVYLDATIMQHVVMPDGSLGKGWGKTQKLFMIRARQEGSLHQLFEQFERDVMHKYAQAERATADVAAARDRIVALATELKTSGFGDVAKQLVTVSEKIVPGDDIDDEDDEGDDFDDDDDDDY